MKDVTCGPCVKIKVLGGAGRLNKVSQAPDEHFTPGVQHPVTAASLEEYPPHLTIPTIERHCSNNDRSTEFQEYIQTQYSGSVRPLAARTTRIVELQSPLIRFGQVLKIYEFDFTAAARYVA